MKILYAATKLGTINSFLLPHIQMLQEEGHEVHVLAHVDEKQKLNSKKLENSCKVYSVPLSRNPLSINNVKAFSQMKRILKKEQYDLIHTHTPIASALIRLANRQTIRTKMVYTAHGFHFYKGAPTLNWFLFYPIEKILAKDTDLLITINEEDYLIAQKKLRPRNVVKMNGVGIDTEKFFPLPDEEKKNMRKSLGIAKNEFVLFYAAELNKNKNQQLLLRMLSKLVKDVPTAHLYLAGRGPLKDKYKKLSVQLGVEDHVTFLGQINNVQDWLQVSDVLVASSQREGLPVNLMEGMASGLPIVATNVRGHKDIVRDDANGYLVSVDDYETMYNKVLVLYTNIELKERIRKNNLAQSKQYSIEKQLNTLKEIEVNLDL